MDGSARTFNCVDVIPCTGATVGVGGGGSGVSDGCSVEVGGSVAVMISGGAAVGILVWIETLQLATRKLVRKRNELESFNDTE